MLPKLGETASITKKITLESIKTFAETVGDFNPLHFDDEFAKNEGFDERIAHGMLVGSLVSTVLGNKLPGPGTIYLGQSFNFIAPVYVNDIIRVQVKIIHVRDDKPIITLSTVCINQDGENVLEGEAVVAVKNE